MVRWKRLPANCMLSYTMPCPLLSRALGWGTKPAPRLDMKVDHPLERGVIVPRFCIPNFKLAGSLILRVWVRVNLILDGTDIRSNYRGAFLAVPYWHMFPKA